MTPAVASYVIYIAAMIAVTVGVGRSLYHHGEPFLIDVFAGNGELAQQVNKLLLAGFYLTNIAVVLLSSRILTPVVTPVDAFHFVMGRMGFILMLLGGMHFFNVAVLLRVRHSTLLPRIRTFQGLRRR